MPINTMNKNGTPQKGKVPAKNRSGGTLLTWLCAGLFLSLSQPQINESKPQVRKETFRQYVMHDDTPQLSKFTETEYNIYGKVIQFTEYQLDENGQTVVHQRSLHKYNAQGHLVGTMRYNQDGDLIENEDIVRDQQGRKIRVNTTSYFPNKQYGYTLYEYDALHNEIAVRAYNEKDEPQSEILRTYNEQGEALSTVRWWYEWEENKWVKKNQRIENEYNDRGQLLRSSSENQIGKNKIKDVRFFENGFICEWLHYENNKLLSHFKNQKRDTSAHVQKSYEIPPPIPFQDPFLEYDDAKRDPLENINHLPVSTATLKHDANGNVIKKVLREHNQVVQVVYYEYDLHNNPIYQKTIYKPDDSVEEIRRSYDAHNNMTKEVFLREGKVVSESTYLYLYYE